MGIKDLLPSLKPISKFENISIYRGRTVAIDGYCWLHQAAYSCAMELIKKENNGAGVEKFVNSCRQKLDMVIAAGVRPLLIFDGNRLSMKQGVESERARNREKACREAEEYLKVGEVTMAQRKFNEAVDITPDLANCFIRTLNSMNVEFYVAPYEADAQLAYVFRQKLVSAVITEDSDLLAFGVTDVFFKMDRNGNGIRIDLMELQEIPEFENFRGDMLLYTCILSGCDYLDSIKGIGFKKASRLVKDVGADLDGILRKIRREGKHIVPLDYEASFVRALLTFKFQRVFCPMKRDIVHHIDPEEVPRLKGVLEKQGDTDFLGEAMDKDTAARVCLGELNPITKDYFMPMVPLPRQQEESKHGEMKVFMAKGKGQTKAQLKKEKAKQANNLTKYWKKPGDEPGISQLSAKSQVSAESKQKEETKEWHTGTTMSKDDMGTASVTSAPSNAEDAGKSSLQKAIDGKMKQRTRTFKLKGSQKVTLAGASAAYDAQAFDGKREESGDRSSSYALRESLSVMTSAQKAWINGGNKKRPLDDIIPDGLRQSKEDTDPRQKEGENEIATNAMASKSVNFKNKKRKYAPRAYFPADPDAGQTIQHTAAIFGDDTEQQREAAPWAFEKGEFIQAKGTLGKKLETVQEKIDTDEEIDPDLKERRRRDHGLSMLNQNSSLTRLRALCEKQIESPRTDKRKNEHGASLPSKMQKCAEQFGDSYNIYMNFLNKR